MMQLKIDRQPANYRPGERISGTVLWDNLNDATSLEVRLIWFTKGKGTRDFELVAAVEIQCEHILQGSQTFEFRAPHRPLSFSASLLSVTWAIELIVFPDQDSMSQEICISPTAEEIRLDECYDEQAKSMKGCFSFG